MANTYSQITIQLVFSVKHREALVEPKFKNLLEMYITGIIQAYGHKLLAISRMPDHCHILVGLNPNQSISELVRLIKSNSSKYINEQKFCRKKFGWQNGYGAFSYSLEAMSNVAAYIENQEEHHRKKAFKMEYIDLLETYDVDYEENYLFDWNILPD